jgi:hypothetical protein
LLIMLRQTSARRVRLAVCRTSIHAASIEASEVQDVLYARWGTGLKSPIAGELAATGSRWCRSDFAKEGPQAVVDSGR